MLKLTALAAASLLWLIPLPGQAAQPVQTETLRSDILEVKHDRRSFRHAPPGRHHWHRGPPRHHSHRLHPPRPRVRHFHHRHQPKPRYYYPAPHYYYYPPPRGGLHFHLSIPH